MLLIIGGKNESVFTLYTEVSTFGEKAGRGYGNIVTRRFSLHLLVTVHTALFKNCDEKLEGDLPIVAKRLDYPRKSSNSNLNVMIESSALLWGCVCLECTLDSG